MPPKLSPEQFAETVKAKYPQYKDVDNALLTQKMVAKYPQYAERIGTTSPSAPVQPKSSLLNKAGNAINALFPAKNIGEAIGTGIAKMRATPEEKEFIEPSKATLGGVAGDVAQNALFFAPLGRAAGLIEKGVSSVAPKLTGGASRTVARVGTGAGAGYGLDVASNFSDGEQNKLAPGAGTVLGGGLPLIGPAFRGAGKLAAQSLGVSTGTGADVIKEGYAAARAGGDSAKTFKEAVRGKTSSETIVDDARSALGELKDNRSSAYDAGLKKIQDETFITKAGKTYVKRFDPELSKTLFVPTNLTTKGVKDVATRTLKSIGLDAKGRSIDFSKRPSLDAKGIQKIHDFVYNWDDMTPLGLNQLRQEVAGFRKGGVSLSPSESRFNTYVDNLTENIRSYVGEKVPQVGEMNKAYAKATQSIKEIQQGLSLGKNAQTDTAFRKLTSVLRTNNEFRQELLSQLESEASRNLPEKIAGQQLSEILPRGLARPLGGTAAGVGLLSGIGILPLLKAALFTSPRVVGEMLLGLGFTARQANAFGKAMGARGLILPVVGTTNVANNDE